MSFADILKSLDDGAARRLAEKVPSWAGVALDLPSSLNLQQCSGESAARYKASLLPSGVRLADLTGGLGVDSWAFSLRSSAVWYNERDSVLCEAVMRNFALLGVSGVEFNNFDIGAPDSLWEKALGEFAPDVIYLDPARRDAAGRKVFLLEDCSPDVVALMPLLLELAPMVLVKVSPMADITMLRRRLAPWLSEIHVVGAGSECKELLCLCRGATPTESSVRIVLAENGHVFNGMEQNSGQSDLLFVPSAAMVKSGLGPGLCRIPYDRHLSHFGKFYQVLEELQFASSVIKDLGRRYPRAEVTARGLPLKSEELRARLKVKPGGPVHIFACAMEGERCILVCNMVDAKKMDLITRVQEMEERFCRAGVAPTEDDISVLREYMDSGQWLADYEADEREDLPRTMKRGVLSQDALFDLLESLEHRKKVEVVAAIIRKGNRILATQRGYGDWKDWWEFPGGKTEPGESPEAALVREIREELDVEISVDKYITTIEWDYPAFHLTMHCYICSLLTEVLHLNEHKAARWLCRKDLRGVKWLPADELLFPYIENELL